MSDAIFDIFREEALEHFSAIEKAFLDLESADSVEPRRNLIDNLFRHAHSLKGDAKVVGLTELKAAAQLLEDLLDELRVNPDAVDRDSIDRGLAQFDRVRDAFDGWQRQDVIASETVPTVPTSAAALPPQETEIATATTEPSGSREPPPHSAGRARPAASDDSLVVRVPSQRLDRMLNLAGEVRIFQRSADGLQDRLNGLSEHLTATLRGLPGQASRESQQALEVALDQVRRISGELHNKQVREELLLEGLEADIRQARLLPLAMLTDILRRAVRDLSQSLGKPLRYEADVGTIMLDKAVIEALKDPLLHLIRNAADHGVETPDVRRAAGKPAEGIIAIAASQRGQVVRITASDDGGGLDFARIRESLRQRGEPDAELESVANLDLVPNLFKPGFTTAAAGEVSGRGVGLDVVFNAVRRLQGSVELLSTSSAGTTFQITVPVTISSVRILTVSSGGQSFGVPSSSVIRTGRIKRSELQQLEGEWMLSVDGEPVRWVHLSDLLGATRAPLAIGGATSSYLLIASNDQNLAVEVEQLEDESEVLLKPLGFPLSSLPGIIGGAIRADGSVQLVVDLTSSHWIDRHRGQTEPRDRPRAVGRIMVVDDSPITRAVLRKVFIAAGYAVVTATDGIDAFEQLRTRPVDVVVTDVEMPRLNGFDLTRRIKSKFGFPVILVTGREKEEHRREGLAAGADAYVVKSTFEDQSLLEIVEQFL